MTPEDFKVSKEGQRLAALVDQELERIAGKRMGFVLLTFSLDVQNHRPTYISNCDRRDMEKTMKRLLKLWNRGMPDIPAHEIRG